MRVLDPADSVPEKPRMEDLQDSTVWQHDIQVSIKITDYVSYHDRTGHSTECESDSECHTDDT